jgi:hypothetical protein
MKRHGHLLASMKGRKKDVHRQNWATYANFKEMYDNTYYWMKKTGIARKYPMTMLLDRAGDECLGDNNKKVLPVDLELVHPERLLFLDETGCNTNQKDDGQVGDKRCIGEKGGRANITASTTDIRFTVLPVSNAVGHAVLCVVIFQSESQEIPFNWISGIDTFATAIDDDDKGNWLRKNSDGVGKRMPYGPCYKVGEVDVPAFVTVSQPGGITGQMLADVLEYLDKLGVFPGDEGPDPMIILDGHNSRFSLPFLCYINDPATQVDLLHWYSLLD